MINENFFKGKRVLVTGHTGFKGSWLCKVLVNLEATVIGYSLEPPTNPNLFSLLNSKGKINSIIGDVRDFNHLKEVFCTYQPEIVIHLAAQPIVRQSYIEPATTYEINVMGTVNICECIRLSRCVKAFLNVTTDKVYYNNEWEWGYRENDILDGHDPYSNSKSCSELVTHSYIRSFFDDMDVATSTARAGNVIGGGDFGRDRLIPDCVRAAISKNEIVIRNPYSTRPYQHVLEAIMAYLLIVQKEYEDKKYAGAYNIGPEVDDCVTTKEMVEKFCKNWNDNLRWRVEANNGPHEANCLKLDCSKIKTKLGWKPKWNYDIAIEKTIEWSKAYIEGQNIELCMDKQIREYLNK